MSVAWHRRFIAAKWDYTARRQSTGRPTTRAIIKTLILRLANEIPGGTTREFAGN